MLTFVLLVSVLNFFDDKPAKVFLACHRVLDIFHVHDSVVGLAAPGEIDHNFIDTPLAQDLEKPNELTHLIYAVFGRAKFDQFLNVKKILLDVFLFEIVHQVLNVVFGLFKLAVVFIDVPIELHAVDF